MIYEVRARLFFDTQHKAEVAVQTVVNAMQLALVVHPDEDNQQGCYVEMIKCYHDETPTRPCESYQAVYIPGPPPE